MTEVMNYDAVPFVGYPDQVVKRDATIENRILISQMGCNFTVHKLKRIDKNFVIKSLNKHHNTTTVGRKSNGYSDS